MSTTTIRSPIDHAKTLSGALQDFHRALIRAEIGDDPELQNPYTRLFALIGDPRFAWMGTLSGLVARIDHQVAKDEMDGAALREAHASASALLGEGEAGQDERFRLRHLIAIQKDPDVGLATGRLRAALRGTAAVAA